MIFNDESLSSCAIIIPTYKIYAKLTEYEKLSLDQCLNILSSYPIFLVKPNSLSLDGYMQVNPKLFVESFDNNYFNTVKSYNELLLSQMFYSRFIQFKYILIYQLDAFVFTNDLLFWCNQGYDYIGAPWLAQEKNIPIHVKLEYEQRIQQAYLQNKKVKNSNIPSHLQFYNRVGNGGFSLRNVKLLYKICGEMEAKIETYLKNDWHPYFNEDVFWSLEVNRETRELNIPDYKTACLFSLEHRPILGMKYNDGYYPFGCHGWSKWPYLWRGLFKYAGYNI